MARGHLNLQFNEATVRHLFDRSIGPLRNKVSKWAAFKRDTRQNLCEWVCMTAQWTTPTSSLGSWSRPCWLCKNQRHEPEADSDLPECWYQLGHNRRLQQALSLLYQTSCFRVMRRYMVTPVSSWACILRHTSAGEWSLIRGNAGMTVLAKGLPEGSKPHTECLYIPDGTNRHPLHDGKNPTKSTATLPGPPGNGARSQAQHWCLLWASWALSSVAAFVCGAPSIEPHCIINLRQSHIILSCKIV